MDFSLLYGMLVMIELTLPIPLSVLRSQSQGTIQYLDTENN